MKKYIVVEGFEDLQDDNFMYYDGDDYPRDGYEPTKARIKQLVTSKNRRGIPLIEEVRESY